MNKVDPPHWAERFLQWYCNPEFLEEIEGDIYELFYRRAENQSSKLAKLKFAWDVFRFFRWSNIKKSNSKNTHMNKSVLFKNYLKLGIRNIQRNMVSSSINIFGLAIAISFAITIFIFVDMQLNMDKFHTNGERIYQLTSNVKQEGNNDLWGSSPLLLGPQMKAENPIIESFTRFEFQSASVKHNADVFDELMIFVDSDFMNIFDFSIMKGNRDALQNKNQIIISDAIATKYFEYEDPIGKELSVKFLNGKIQRFTIGAVLNKPPYNSSFRTNILIPFDNFQSINSEINVNWTTLTDATIVMLKKGASIETLSSSFPKYLELQNGSKSDWKIESFNPIPLYELSLNGYRISGSLNGGGHPAGRLALSLMACFLLGMACFNFMNISVASSTKRLKEIALRKVMGGIRKQITSQFLVENILQCFFALLIGVLLAYFLMVPGFDYLIPQMDLQLRSYSPEKLIIFLATILVVVGLISGAYPALYISRFDAIAIFKGNQKLGSGNFFSKIMLGFQFFLATLTIVACFALTDQSIYLASKDWGYNPSGTISIYVNSTDQLEKMKQEMASSSDLLSSATATNLIGRSIPLRSIELGDKQVSARVYGVSEDYFETMQLKIINGRPITDHANDQNNGVVVNETFLKQFGWTDSPIDQSFTLDSTRYTIIGVVKDFHYYDFYSKIEPLVIRGINDFTPRYLSFKSLPENVNALKQFTHDAWAGIAPNDPFDVVYQQDVFRAFYLENSTNITITIVISIIAIILACLGLYGLLAFSIQKKLREFSIRKVLGATPGTIAKIAGKQYSWVLVISFLLGAPLGYWGMIQLISTIFPDPKEISALPFVISIGVITITLVFTVTGQVLKAINVNPANILRSE